MAWIMSCAVTWVVLSAGCGGGSEGDGRGRTGQSGPPQVSVATPYVRDVTTYFEYNGFLESIRRVTVRARVPGFLTGKSFTDSSVVEAGQVLFTIEPEPYELAVKRARASLDRARALQRAAEARLQRSRSARERGAANELEIIENEAAVAQRQAEAAEAGAALRQAEIDLSYTRVTAPFSGRIDQNLVDVGNLVGATENTPLASIVQQDPLHVFFDVSERIALDYLAKGRTGNIPQERADPVFVGVGGGEDYPFEGRLDFVDNTVDPSTGTIRVRGEVPNTEGRLYPGLFARVRVPFERLESAVLVVRDAVGVGLEGPYLLVVDEDDTIERRPVEIGQRQDDGTVVVRSGIETDERYVVAGLQRAAPGRTVDPVEVDDPLRAGAGPRTPGPERPLERPPRIEPDDGEASGSGPGDRDPGGSGSSRAPGPGAGGDGGGS